jgi:tRNA1Val (adenine37-N6)-methyltransferase
MLTLDSIRNIKVYQSKKGYRFSVDSLLLFSFVKVGHAKKVCDLGAGSGIIGLLLAKESPHLLVYLVELQKGLYENCLKNIRINDLMERVYALNEDIKEIARGRAVKGLEANTFDIVVSNPPFRRPKTGKISPEDERAIARHEIAVELKDVLQASSRLLKNGGRLYIIYLPERIVELFEGLKDFGLEAKRLRFVHSRLNEPAKMVLVEAAKGRRPGIIVERPFIVYNTDGTYTEEMNSVFKEQ